MKTLHAKGAVILSLGCMGVVSVIFIFLSINSFWEGRIDESIMGVFFAILFLLLGVFCAIDEYRKNWIQYGNGKVVIRRVSKDRVNGGRPVGKWKNREDIFMLEEIDSYGLSWQVLGHYVEWHRSSGNYKKNITEYFFKLKNGKIIGIEITCYTGRQLKEFIHYIYENTGIEFQTSKNKDGEKVT